MFRIELLLIQPLVVAAFVNYVHFPLTVSEANREYSYYGTSKVRDQKPQPINGQIPLLLPRRPVTGPVTAAPDTIAAPSPVLNGPAEPEPALQPDPDFQSLGGHPEPTQEIVQDQEPCVLVAQFSDINVPQSNTPVALPPLLPMPQNAQELCFGRQLHPSVPPTVQQPEHALQPEYIPHPEPTQEIVQTQEPAVLLERNAVSFPEPLSINVVKLPTPVALPHLLPKPLPVRGLAFGRHLQPSITPMIYYPTATYPTQTPSPSYPPTPPRTVATQAPSVVVTTQSYPAVTQASGQVFQCKEENGYYSIEHECDTFIECKQNRAMQYACPDGLHFNPAAKHYEYPCANPSEVKCAEPAQPTADCPHQYGYFASPVASSDNCGQYRVCAAGKAIEMVCSTGLAFNSDTGRCDWPDQVTSCKTDRYLGFSCPAARDDVAVNYKYQGNCYYFFSCQKGQARLLSCDSGLAFDPDLGRCVNADNVNCEITPLAAAQPQ